MSNRFRKTLAALCFSAALSTLATAQVPFPEAEPNGPKAEATGANCLVAGDFLSGLTTGNSTTAGNSADASADTFRVKTCPLPLGIYKHTLAITTSGTAGHTGTIRGKNQTGTISVGGTIGMTDVSFQTSVTTSTPARSNSWFGFGRGEEIYYRVTGSATTTGAYTSTLSTVTIVPTSVAGSFTPGSITMTTVVQGVTVDTDMVLYDSSFNYIGQNDDEFIGTTLQSRLTRTLATGTYYLGVGTYNTANNQPSQADDDFVSGNVLDFADVVANSSSDPFATNVSISISDGSTTTPVALSDSAPYEIVWVRLTVGTPITNTPFCFGDGTGSACPCANTGAAGHGCASQAFPGGGILSSVGNAGASIGTDTLVLTATDVPGPGLFFQANGIAGTPINFGDGHLCASIGIVRLGAVFPTGNSASYPGGLTPNPIHIAGGTMNGDTRHYQCWYRTQPGLCNPQNFNLTQGLTFVWGP